MSARVLLALTERELRVEHGDEAVDELLDPPTAEELRERRLRGNLAALDDLDGEVAHA